MVTRLPIVIDSLQDHQLIQVDGIDWEIVVGRGHAQNM
jgi:hypothetical protein